MDVLLFRMEPKLLKKPAAKNSIVYTGTHDNDTAEEAYGISYKSQPPGQTVVLPAGGSGLCGMKTAHR